MADLKKFTRKEIATRNSKTDAVTIIDNQVYELTKFLDDHPGGHEVLLQAAGRDSSEDFDDVGHSLDAKELMKKFLVGELVDEDKAELKKKSFAWEESSAAAAPAGEDAGFLSSWKFPVALGLLITVVYSYLFG